MRWKQVQPLKHLSLARSQLSLRLHEPHHYHRRKHMTVLPERIGGLETTCHAPCLPKGGTVDIHTFKTRTASKAFAACTMDTTYCCDGTYRIRRIAGFRKGNQSARVVGEVLSYCFYTLWSPQRNQFVLSTFSQAADQILLVGPHIMSPRRRSRVQAIKKIMSD